MTHSTTAQRYLTDGTPILVLLNNEATQEAINKTLASIPIDKLTDDLSKNMIAAQKRMTKAFEKTEPIYHNTDLIVKAPPVYDGLKEIVVFDGKNWKKIKK